MIRDAQQRFGQAHQQHALLGGQPVLAQKRFNPDVTGTTRAARATEPAGTTPATPATPANCARRSHRLYQHPRRVCGGLGLLRGKRRKGEQMRYRTGLAGQVGATNRLAQAVDLGNAGVHFYHPFLSSSVSTLLRNGAA